MNKIKAILLLSITSCFFLLATPAHADNAPDWYGTVRNLYTDMPIDGIEVVWELYGNGNSFESWDKNRKPKTESVITKNGGKFEFDGRHEYGCEQNPHRWVAKLPPNMPGKLIYKPLDQWADKVSWVALRNQGVPKEQIPADAPTEGFDSKFGREGGENPPKFVLSNSGGRRELPYTIYYVPDTPIPTPGSSPLSSSRPISSPQSTSSPTPQPALSPKVDIWAESGSQLAGKGTSGGTLKINVDQPTTIAWTAQNASSCVASGNWASIKKAGTIRLSQDLKKVLPGTTYNYTLTCFNNETGEQETDTVIVSVNPGTEKPRIQTEEGDVHSNEGINIPR